MKKLAAVLLIVALAQSAYGAVGQGISTFGRYVDPIVDGDLFMTTDVSDTAQSDDGTSKSATALQVKNYVLTNQTVGNGTVGPFFDGTSDGGNTLNFYGSLGFYTSIVGGSPSANRSYTLPTEAWPAVGQQRLLSIDSSGQMHFTLDPATIGADDQTAAEVSVNTANFGGTLTSADINVQLALDRIDDLVVSGTDDQTAAEVLTDTTTFNGTFSGATTTVQAALNIIDDLAITGADDQTAAEVSVEASGFDGNLSTTDDTVQKVAQKVDDLVLGASTASATTTITTNFGGNLSAADDTVQKALDTLDDMAGGGGLLNVVEDTTPQLGGDLDIQTFSIEGVDAIEFGYLNGVTSSVQTQINGKQASSTNLTAWSALATTAKQDTDSDLTSIASLATQSYGRTFLTNADAAAARTYLGVGSTDDVTFGTVTTSAVISSAADGEHYVDAVNTTALNTSIASVAGRIAYYNSRVRLSDGTDWDTYFLTDSDISQTLTNGDTTHAISNDAVYDGLAGKQAADADLTTWSGVTPGTGVATALAVNVDTAGGISRIIAKGSNGIDAANIPTGTCTEVIHASATGVVSGTGGDNIIWDFAADPTAVTGFTPATTGMITVVPYPSTDYVNFKFCNTTAADINPGSVTINWRVLR